MKYTRHPNFLDLNYCIIIKYSNYRILNFNYYYDNIGMAHYMINNFHRRENPKEFLAKEESLARMGKINLFFLILRAMTHLRFNTKMSSLKWEFDFEGKFITTPLKSWVAY